MTGKQAIRREIAAKRTALSPDQIATASRQIADTLLALEEFGAARSVALYMALPGEVRLDGLFPACWKQGKRTCIPVFNARARLYDLAEIDADTRFETGHYGIREPVDVRNIDIEEVDFMVVPGVAFDETGRRLGRGGGYYDRLLARFAGFSCAVAFDFQLLPRIPAEPHDLPVDAIATETKIVKVRNER